MQLCTPCQKRQFDALVRACDIMSESVQIKMRKQLHSGDDMGAFRISCHFLQLHGVLTALLRVKTPSYDALRIASRLLMKLDYLSR